MVARFCAEPQRTVKSPLPGTACPRARLAQRTLPTLQDRDDHRSPPAEPMQRRRPVRPAPQTAERTEQAGRQDLPPEVPPVERAAENRLVHRLQLTEREGARKQRVDEVRVLELRPEPLGRRAHDGD